MKVVMVAQTWYEVLIAYIVSITEYKKGRDQVILILEGDYPLKEKIYKNARGITVWDKVHSFSVFAQGILEKQLQENGLYECDVLHLSTPAPVSQIGATLCEQGNAKKIIINDEGTSCYDIGHTISQFNENATRISRDCMFDYNKISEVLLLDSCAYVPSVSIPARSIDLTGFICYLKDGGIEELNKLFNYQYDGKFREAILFDSPIDSADYATLVDSTLLNYLIKSVSDCVTKMGHEILIKMHPSRIHQEVRHMKKIPASFNLVPWEVILLNEVIVGGYEQPRLYVSYVSTAVYNCVFFCKRLGIPFRAIQLEEYIANFWREKSEENIAINQIIQEYGADNIMVPQEMVEIKKGICEFYGGQINENTVYKEEIDWHREYYKMVKKNSVSVQDQFDSYLVINKDYENKNGNNIRITNSLMDKVYELHFSLENVGCQNALLYIAQSMESWITLDSLKVNGQEIKSEEILMVRDVDEEVVYKNGTESQKVITNGLVSEDAVGTKNEELWISFSGSHISCIDILFKINSMSDIRRELQRVGKLNRFYKGLFDPTDKEELQNNLGSYADKTIAIYGAGTVGKEMLWALTDLNYHIDYFIESIVPEKKRFGIEIIAPDEIILRNVSLIIISITYREHEIKDSILRIAPDVDVMTIEELFATDNEEERKEVEKYYVK